VKWPLPMLNPDVLPVCRYTSRNRVRSADPLQVSRDVAVIQFGIVTAVAADELIGIGVAAFGATRHEVDRLTSQDHRPSQHLLNKGLHDRGLVPNLCRDG
jgi:hypothetical protein